jgi:glucose/mannose transport system permease protein
MTTDALTNGAIARAPRAVALDGPAGPRPKRITASRVGIYAFLIIMAIFFCIPLYVMLVTSFKAMPEVRQAHLFDLPHEWTIEPWIKAWSYACTGRDCTGLSPGFLNSWKVAIPSVIISIIIAQLNGYALSFWRYKGANIFFNLLLFGAFVPYQVLVYPIIMGMRGMPVVTDWIAGWFGLDFPQWQLFATLPGIILVHTIFGMPILTLLYRNYYSSIPIEIFKAARIDGAGFWQIFFRVMLPLSIPITTVALILQVTGIWNDFLFALVFAGRDNIPMTLQLNNIVKTTFGTIEYDVNMAATILTALVPLAIYFISGKWFVRGIAAGAVKG